MLVINVLQYYTETGTYCTCETAEVPYLQNSNSIPWTDMTQCLKIYFPESINKHTCQTMYNPFFYKDSVWVHRKIKFIKESHVEDKPGLTTEQTLSEILRFCISFITPNQLLVTYYENWLQVQDSIHVKKSSNQASKCSHRCWCSW